MNKIIYYISINCAIICTGGALLEGMELYFIGMGFFNLANAVMLRKLHEAQERREAKSKVTVKDLSPAD